MKPLPDQLRTPFTRYPRRNEANMWNSLRLLTAFLCAQVCVGQVSQEASAVLASMPCGVGKTSGTASLSTIVGSILITHSFDMAPPAFRCFPFFLHWGGRCFQLSRVENRSSILGLETILRTLSASVIGRRQWCFTPQPCPLIPVYHCTRVYLVHIFAASARPSHCLY